MSVASKQVSLWDMDNYLNGEWIYMLKRTTEGYIYISQKTNIQYGLFEGVTIGGDKQYTSDIIFVMLVDPNYNVDNNVVGYLFGASFLPNSENYEESIGLMVNEFEERNGLLL